MNDKKRRYGPAPKSEAEIRSIRTGIYFNKNEYGELLKKVFPFGCDGLSELAIKKRIGIYIRNLINDTLPPMIPSINSQAWLELSKANSNLNQAMQIANKFSNSELLNDISFVKSSVDELRYKLIGITFNSTEPEDLEVDDES